MTRDGVPVYQQSPSCPGAFVLSVHSGVTLAPFHCGAMVETLRSGTLDAATFQPFSPERFDVQAA
jgi:glycine/D-amino acid oxidase-like deaminating enzyme